MLAAGVLASLSRRDGVPTAAAEVVDPTDGEGDGGARVPRLTTLFTGPAEAAADILEAAAIPAAKRAASRSSLLDMMAKFVGRGYCEPSSGGGSGFNAIEKGARSSAEMSSGSFRKGDDPGSSEGGLAGG